MLTEGMFLVDRYEILSKVGAGGMSDVYKAKDHILGRVVAIKELKQEFSEDINFVTKFRTEAQSAAGLEHPNIVNIYDVGSENGVHFIVMEYVEGITLKTYIEKKGQLSFKEATSIAIQVARGIEAAHNKDITHRDIKPQNIMISTEGKVKVTDFGIAKAISSNTISADAMGSVHYASPEQARNGFIDGRSDIYSLGIVMYEMVTGRVPFDGDTTVAVAIQHLQEEMVEPSVYAEDLPISYEKIILKCTQKNPERRYQAVEELLADLRQALATPHEDFVVIAPPVVSDTRIINGDDLDEIQASAEEADLESENGFAGTDEEGDEEDEFDEFDEDDEDATGFLDPKMEKVVTYGGIALGVLIVGIIVFLVSSWISDALNFGKANTEDTSTQQTESEITEDVEEVEMIEIVGMDIEKAKTELEKIGLELEIMAYEESDEADGTILDQSEKKGSMVEKGGIISVVVAGENQDLTMIEVPDVTGQSQEDAEALLNSKGFTVGKEFKADDSVEEGKVISQTPDAKTKKTKGTRVTIVVSEGKGDKLVPANLRGQKLDVVTKELDKLGFKWSIVEEKSDEFPTKDTVINVEGAGSYKKAGSVIKLTVSSGPKTVKKDTYKYDKTYSNSNATAYTYKLVDADGNVLSEGTGTGTSVRINATGISTAKGKLTIEWTKEVKTVNKVQSDKDLTGDGIVDENDYTEETVTTEEVVAKENYTVSFDKE